METLIERVNLEHAITSFRLYKGHPAYPVFWDFAFYIHTPDQRWVLMSSSSD